MAARSHAKQEKDAPSRSWVRVILPWLVLMVVAGGVVALALVPGEGPRARRVAATPEVAGSERASAPPASDGATPARSQPQTPQTPQAARAKAQVSFDPPLLQWGFLKPGEVKRLSSSVTNEGDSPIRLTGGMKGCSCTTVDVPAVELGPGESIEFAAVMTAGLTPTTKKSSLKLLLEDHEAISIPTDGEIVRGIRVSPRRISAVSRNVADPQAANVPARVRRVRFDSADRRPFRILRIDGRDVSEFPRSESLLNPMPEHSFAFDDFGDFDAETGLDVSGEEIPLFRLVETDHPDAAVIEVPVDHPLRIARLQPRGERPWFFVENRYVADTVVPGGSTVIEVPLLVDPRRPWQPPTKVTSLSDSFEAELIELAPDGRRYRAKVKVSPTGTSDEAYLGDMLMESEGFSVTVPLIGAVRIDGAGT